MRRADVPVPQALSPELLKHRELVARWVRSERQGARRATLLDEVRQAGIERAEAACDCLLREGWIARRERFGRGRWDWHAIEWRDLERLQKLLGVAGRGERETERQQVLGEVQEWLRARATGVDRAALDPDLLDEATRALVQLSEERALPLEVLRTRAGLLRALAEWHDSGASGLRRDFALRAAGTTKAIGPADWRWLEGTFNLERLRIGQFAPMLWLAGDTALAWQEGRVELAPLHMVGLPLLDVCKVARLEAAPSSYWLVENRASFERQARELGPGQLLLWLPGRPQVAWLDAVTHLLRLAPAPAFVSADADPAGVDIACTAGTLWEAQGLAWEPHRMGLAQWESTSQRWELNEHDRALLHRLLARHELPPALRELCEAMQREGRKAEQESWL